MELLIKKNLITGSMAAVMVKNVMMVAVTQMVRDAVIQMVKAVMMAAVTQNGQKKLKAYSEKTSRC